MHPNLIRIGAFTVHTYGLLLALAFLAGVQISIRYAKREGIAPERIVDMALYIFVAALVGAKLLLLAVDFSYYSQDWSRLTQLVQVGGVFYGGLILAVLTAVLYMRRHRMDFWRTADAMCMGVVAGQALGRIGCFFAGCCWGRECTPGFPLGVVFRDPAAAEQVGTPLFVQLHPVQLYESVLLICLFVVLTLFYRRKRFDGQQLLAYLGLYSVVRFSVEFFRGDPRGSVLGGLLSTSQAISILIFLAAGTALFFRRRSLQALQRA